MNKNFFKKINKFEPKGFFPQLDVFWKKAEGVYVYDKRNKKYLDFTSTIFVSNIGHSNSTLIKYLKSALNSKIIHSYNFPNPFREKYVKKLLKFYGKKNKKVFLLSGGSETLECAIKLMRLYGQKINKDKNGIITLEGNWHGRTMGSQLLSSDKMGKKWIGFKDPNIHHLSFPYPWEVNEKNGEYFFNKSLKKLNINFKKKITGIILETFQGWGSLFYPKSFVKAVEKFCKKNDILLVFDEMQSGFGRTGEKFGFHHYKVSPNLVCCGKGMGSGYPLSGIIGDSKVLDLAPVGSLSSTHSANPLACAAGLATLEELNKKNLIKKSKILGEIMFSKLNELKKQFPMHIKHISCKGLIAAIIFKNENESNQGTILANKVCEKSLYEGLILVKTGRNSIKIGPPLIINKKQLIEGLNIIENMLRKTVMND